MVSENRPASFKQPLIRHRDSCLRWPSLRNELGSSFLHRLVSLKPQGSRWRLIELHASGLMAQTAICLMDPALPMAQSGERVRRRAFSHPRPGAKANAGGSKRSTSNRS